jgi:hypothetical protein
MATRKPPRNVPSAERMLDAAVAQKWLDYFWADLPGYPKEQVLIRRMGPQVDAEDLVGVENYGPYRYVPSLCGDRERAFKLLEQIVHTNHWNYTLKSWLTPKGDPVWSLAIEEHPAMCGYHLGALICGVLLSIPRPVTIPKGRITHGLCSSTPSTK